MSTTALATAARHVALTKHAADCRRQAENTSTTDSDRHELLLEARAAEAAAAQLRQEAGR